MNMTRIFILLFLVFICALGWVLGGMLSSNAFSMALGVIFGSMVGIPAMLIAVAKPQRHEHYHRVITETPTEPQQQPVAMIPVSTRYIVLDNIPAQLRATTQQRIEVNR